ncbi:hypothetical protein M752DRAFT_278311 [Aspergillus phoenicis ATCC 13157]|nr:hypothetical protein M752DRAFT_278311 [Aspergillus phoenicis ATCC 13157]
MCTELKPSGQPVPERCTAAAARLLLLSRYPSSIMPTSEARGRSSIGSPESLFTGIESSLVLPAGHIGL